MEAKMYIIMVNNEENGWKEFDGIWLTEEEINRDLRKYRKLVKGHNVKFRKKCVYNGPIEKLSIHH